MTKAVAIALNPVTVVDIFSGAGLMLSDPDLSKLYGIQMTKREP